LHDRRGAGAVLLRAAGGARESLVRGLAVRVLDERGEQAERLPLRIGRAEIGHAAPDAVGLVEAEALGVAVARPVCFFDLRPVVLPLDDGGRVHACRAVAFAGLEAVVDVPRILGTRSEE